MHQIHGILIFDKPEGMSSNQALQKAKRLFHAKKAGHTGSLDVLATGLLPICFGEATKFSQFGLEADKAYRVKIALGERTSTGDREGDVIERHDPSVTLKQVTDVLHTFLGESEQVPPMYSALKHRGQPLYKLARKGVEVARKPRKITIHSIDFLDWQGDSFLVDVKCSKGTYIRSLADDIGLALGCGAHVASLRRLAAGPFVVEQMLSIEKIETIREQGGLDALYERLLPIDSLMPHLPSLEVTKEIVQKLQHGQKVSPTAHEAKPETLYRIYHNNEFAGLAVTNDERVLKAKRMLSTKKSQD